MDKEVFNQKNILFDSESKNQDEAFRRIADFAYERGYVKTSKAFYEDLKQREKEVTTGFKDHIAIPHGKSDSILKPGLFLVKFENGIPWNSLDEQPVKIALALAIPEEGSKEHLKLLSLIARKLIDDDFRRRLLNEKDRSGLEKLIDEISF